MKPLSPISPLASESYLQSGKFFFNSSKIAFAQITDLYDFIHPSLTAIWNLRYEVAGYMYVRGSDITKDELNKKFTNHEKFIRPNLYRSCIEFTWDKQKEDFAKVILINLFAYHEAWVENILSELGEKNPKRIKSMQFPSIPGKTGVLEALQDLLKVKSSSISSAFYSPYTINKKYSLPELNNLLITYRYFKECRNSVIHSGGFVDDKMLKAEADYLPITAVDLKLDVKPKFDNFVKDKRFHLSVETVSLFTDVILQIITTLDAELLQSKKSEQVFINRLLNFTKGKPKKLDPFKVKRSKEIRSIIQQSGFLKPNALDDLELMMIDNKIIR